MKKDEFSPIGTSWNEFEKEIFTPEEIAKSDLRVALIGKLIEAREQKGISQQMLAEMSGLKQSAVARLENMKATPQIDTLFKILKPLGYTLAIVPDNTNFNKTDETKTPIKENENFDSNWN